ncbi:esterase/lipase family protein [Chitinimonas sp. PSY-7]|uniref:alpha/beta fold hydrolase n=1 Tax=Chitinimonas sp. PSY-7 TaxID=3459088 RepID=UPI0040403E91
MPRSLHSSTPSAGYLPAAKAAFIHTAKQVETVHLLIAETSFEPLLRFPLLKLPVRAVHQIHNAMLGKAYSAVRLGGVGLLSLVGLALRPSSPPPGVSRLQSILNGAFGDTLEAGANPLAYEMSFYEAGSKSPLDQIALAQKVVASGGRLCVFIHGLGLDEHCWQGEADFGQRLSADFGYAPIYLRYNSGRSIQTNAAALAICLHECYANLPYLNDLLLVGHSMGGLLARSAVYHAAEAGMGWLQALHMVVCLGAPHRGAPLERIGRLLTVAMQLNQISTPFAALAQQRSQGVQDLHDGLLDPESGRTQPILPGVPYRFVASSLLPSLQHPTAQILGDGMVPLPSASDPGLDGDVAVVQLAGIGHMGLLKHPKVYEALHTWLTEQPA